MDTATLPSAADALKSLNGFQMPDSATVLGQAQTKYGVNDLATKVAGIRSLTSNLTNAIAAVDPSVTGRTSGTLTTEGQRSALVSRERAPVVQQLGTANDALNTSKEEYNTADTKSRDEANMLISDNKAKHDRLLETYNLANAREAAAAQAAAEAEARRQAQSNSDREYQLQVKAQADAARASASSRSASAAKAAKLSPAELKQQDMSTIASNLESKKGKDNHVSQETWNRALSDWVKAGYSASEFVKNNIRYINQRYKGYSGYN